MVGKAPHIKFLSPAERLIFLRGTGFFANLPLDDLVTMAQRSRERFFRRGSIMASEGRALGSHFIIAEGTASLRRGGHTFAHFDAPSTVGALAVLSRDPNGIEIRADTDVLALEQQAHDVFESLEENFSLLEAVLRQLARELSLAQMRVESMGLLQREVPFETPFPEGELDLVDRLTLLRQGSPFKSSSLNALAELARHSKELRFEPGAVLWSEGQASDFGVFIAHGIVRCTGQRPAREFEMGPLSTIGSQETLARLPRSYSAVAKTRVVGLRNDPDSFLDVLENHVELGIGFCTFLAERVLKLYELAGPNHRA